MPVGGVDGPFLKKCCNRQDNVRHIHGLVKELVDGHNHFEFFEGLDHLVAVEVLAERVLAGHPEHAYWRIICVENDLGGFVDIEDSVRVGYGGGIITSCKMEVTFDLCLARNAFGPFGLFLQQGVVIESPGTQVAVTGSTADLADVTGHGNQGVDGPYRWLRR